MPDYGVIIQGNPLVFPLWAGDQMMTFYDFYPEVGASGTPHCAERPSLVYGSCGEGVCGPGRADAGVVGRCLGGRLSLIMSPHFVFLHYA